MKISSIFSHIPYKKYLAGFLVTMILISQTIHVDFFDRVEAGPENYRDIVSIIVDEDTYSTQRTRVLRYAEDIAGYLGGVRTSIFVVDANTPAQVIAAKNEKLYYEGDGEKGTSILVGTVLIGNIPIPMVDKDGSSFPSLYPYVDFDNKVFLYDSKSDQYSYSSQNPGTESADIWHGVINPAVGRPWTGAADIQKIRLFLDKTHDFYTRSGKFVPSLIPPKVFFYNGHSESKSISPRALYQYSLYIKNIENIAYNRFTKYLLRDVNNALIGFDAKTEDPEITTLYSSLGISPGADTLTEDQIKKTPDIQTKNITLSFLKNFKSIFNEKTLGDELLAVHNAGRYSSGSIIGADLVPISVSLMDEMARSTLYEANTALENKIDNIIADGKFARRIPIFDEVQTSTGLPLSWTSQLNVISQNYAFGRKSTTILEPLDCTIARGNFGDIDQFGRAELVEANTAFDILSVEPQVKTLEDDTTMLVAMGRPNCFPSGNPAITPYWGGNSVLRIAAGGSGDPSEVLDTFPAVTQFQGFTAPIFSLQGMKESDRLRVGTVADCMASPYQYTLFPARITEYIDPLDGSTCNSAYPSEWTNGSCGRRGGVPRYTCISNVSPPGVPLDLESSVYNWSNTVPSVFSRSGIFARSIFGDCINGSLIIDGIPRYAKNNYCTYTNSDSDSDGNTIAGDVVDITTYTQEIYHTIPSIMKHVSPTPEEVNAAQSSGITPGLAVDMVRYFEFYTNKGNIARINYPNFFDIPSNDIPSARAWIKAQSDAEWQKIINLENATTTTPRYDAANVYLGGNPLPSSPIDWNTSISDDMILKIIQAKNWLHPDISLKYRQSIESILSYSHENTLVTPLVETPPKIPSLSTEYEIAYLGLPSTFAADFSNTSYSNSIAEYDAKLREIEGVNISDEAASDLATSENSAAECGPPDGVPLFQWPSAIMCWIKAQFPPKILAGSCGPTSIGLDKPSSNLVTPPEKISQDATLLTAFYAGSRVIPYLPRSSMNLRDAITVDLSLQNATGVLSPLPGTMAQLEIESIQVGGVPVSPAMFRDYIQIAPENSVAGERGSTYVLTSQGKPALVNLKGYYSIPLPGGSDLRVDSADFSIAITPEYYTFGLTHSGVQVANIDATSAEPVTLAIKKILRDDSESIVTTPIKIEIYDDIDGTLIYSGSNFNPSRDALPTSITKKIGVYRMIANDAAGISGEFTFAVEAGGLSQIRIVPISSALVKGTRTLANVRLLDRLGNPISPDVHSLQLDINGGYIVDTKGDKRTSLTIDTMESQIPIAIGSDGAGTLTITATIDGTLSTSQGITIYDAARIVLVRNANPRVGDAPIPVRIEIQDASGNKMAGLSSVASWKLPEGAGTFSKELITITDGLSEGFDYIPGTMAGDHALSIDVPGIGSVTDIPFSLLPGNPLYISHTKDETNIVFSLRDRYGNIASLSTLMGTITRNTELPQSIIFTNGVYSMPIQGGHYTVDVPAIKGNSISYTDAYGPHVVPGIDQYVVYIVGKDEKINFAPDYNARYTVFAGGSFLKEGEDVLYNVTAGKSQSLAVSTVLDTPDREDILVSLLPGGSYRTGGSSQDVALESSITLLQGFPLLTITDLVTRKQVARVLYHMQNANLETCTMKASILCDTPKNTPTIRLITPENSDLTMNITGDTVSLNSLGTSIFSIENDGYIDMGSDITLVPKESHTLGFGIAIMQNGREVASLILMTDASLSVERSNSSVTPTQRNTPVILSSGFSIQPTYGKALASTIVGYKIFRSSTSRALDEVKNGPSDTDSIGSLSEIPGVGWTGNNTMLLAYAGGDTVGEATKLFHTYTFVNLGDPVAHVYHGRPGTEIDGIDRTVGSIIARGTRSGIADFFHRDMNADGISDLVVLYQDGFVELFLNLGGKFRSRGMIAYNKDIDTSQLKFGDFTYDGYGDIIGLNKQGSLVLIDNSTRKFSRPDITLDGGAPVPQNISQFQIYDMDADKRDDIAYITSGGELGILYGTTTPGNFTKKVLDPTLGISLGTDPITTGGAIKASNTPQISGALGVVPVENTGSYDDTMLIDEAYYQYVHTATQVSELTDPSTLGGVFTDIENGKTGQRVDTFVRSQYALAHGLSIEKRYTNTTNLNLHPGDLIRASILIKNTSSTTAKNVEYLDVVPRVFSLDKTETYNVTIGGASVERPFEALAVGDYDMYFVGRDIPPGETLEISYEMIALPASYGEMIVDDLERNTVGADPYGDVGFKTSTTCGASMLLWASGPGNRDYTKGTHDFGAAEFPSGLATQLIDTNGNGIPDSIDNQTLADRQAAYTDMTTANSANRPLVKVTQNAGELTIGFDSDSADSIIDATQNLLDGLACGFGGGSCMSFPMNWAPLAPGSDPVMFGKLLGDGLKIDEGLPIFSALTGIPVYGSHGCFKVPTVWPVSPIGLTSTCGSNTINAGGMLGIKDPANFIRIFVTPTLTLGVGTAICLGGPASAMGNIPPRGLSPLIQGGNCIVMAKPMAVCKGDGSIADGDVAPISGLGTLTDAWNASSCKPQVNTITETEHTAITNGIVNYIKNPDKTQLAGIYNNMSKRGQQNLTRGPMLRIGNASGGGASSIEVEIDSNTKISDISQVVKLKNVRIPAFPDFLMDWLTRQTEELVTALFTPPNLTIIPPTDFAQNVGQIDTSFVNMSDKLGKLYSNASTENIKQGVNTIQGGGMPNIGAMASEVKGTLNTMKVAYSTIGKLPFITIKQVNIPINIPWIKASELDKYAVALNGYLKEIDRAAKNLCVSDPSAACLDKKAKLQSGAFVNSIRENLKRIEEYKRFPTKILKYLTWKDRYIAQLLCNVNIIQQITGGWLRDNGIRFRKWAELFVLIKAIAEGWQPLLDIFLDTSVSCGVCRNERGNAQYFKFKLISALLPSIPVIKFPKWPDIILDLSDIRFAISFAMPNFDPRISPIRLPNLPSLSIGDISAGLSLPALPLLPPLPPLPDLPDLPSLPKIKLPDLPPPPKIPKIAGSLKAFLNVLKLISKMYCYYQKTALIPEWQVGDVIAQRTERQSTSPFDFLTLQMPQFSLPTLREIRIATHVNFEIRSDFISEFSRAAVKPINQFNTDLRLIVPPKIGEDVGIQGKKIDLNAIFPYNIESGDTATGKIAQIFAGLESEKDDYLDVDAFAQHLLSEMDAPELAGRRASLVRELAVARIESEKLQNELLEYNDTRFNFLKDYINSETDNIAQLRNIIDLLESDISGEPRQLVSDINANVTRSSGLLQKFNAFQNTPDTTPDIAIPSSLDRTKASLQSKLARVYAATTGGGSPTSNIAAGYSPNYKGIYIRTPSGVQTQLFDYTDPVSEDTRIDTLDLDLDGDMDYMYVLDGVLYAKYSWEKTRNKILDTTQKISTIRANDPAPFVPDYFHENTSSPKNLNYSFIPSSLTETEWRVEFYDRYLEWDEVDFGTHNPATSPKTVIDMFTSSENTPISNTPIIQTRTMRSLAVVNDTSSFVLQGRNIEIYTGALSLSLSPGRVLYTGKDTVNITYKDLSMTGTQVMALAPYTGYEFSDITEIITNGGTLYLIGAEDSSRYTYSDDFIGMPILSGMEIYGSDVGAVIRNHTNNRDVSLAGGANYITYDLGDSQESYQVSLPYANGYYYARLNNLTVDTTDRAGVILFSPQVSSDDGAPIIDFPNKIRIPIYADKSYRIADMLTDLSDVSLSIDGDDTVDGDTNGIFDDDFAASGNGFSVGTTDLVFGKFATPGNYKMNMKAVDEMGNTTVLPFTVEAYAPIPTIQEITPAGDIVGSIPEPIAGTPIHFFRIRAGDTPQILSPQMTPTDAFGNFMTGSFYRSSETIELKNAGNTIVVGPHGALQLPPGYTTDILPATSSSPMEILTKNPGGSITHSHTLGLPEDVEFTDMSKGTVPLTMGIYVTPVSLTTSVVPVSSSDASFPGGIYITDTSYRPLIAMSREGSIYTMDTTVTLRYGTKNGYIVIDVLRENIPVASIEYHIDFFYTSK